MPVLISRQSLIAFGALCVGACLASAPAAAQQSPKISEQDAYEIARDAYIYAYPLVLMDVTRKQLTNFTEPAGMPGQ